MININGHQEQHKKITGKQYDMYMYGLIDHLNM